MEGKDRSFILDTVVLFLSNYSQNYHTTPNSGHRQSILEGANSRMARLFEYMALKSQGVFKEFHAHQMSIFHTHFPKQVGDRAMQCIEAVTNFEKIRKDKLMKDYGLSRDKIKTEQELATYYWLLEQTFKAPIRVPRKRVYPLGVLRYISELKRVKRLSQETSVDFNSEEIPQDGGHNKSQKILEKLSAKPTDFSDFSVFPKPFVDGVIDLISEQKISKISDKNLSKEEEDIEIIKAKKEAKRLKLQVKVRYLPKQFPSLEALYKEKFMPNNSEKEIADKIDYDQQRIKYLFENYISHPSTWQQAYESLGFSPSDVADMILRNVNDLAPCEKALVKAKGAGWSSETLVKRVFGLTNKAKNERYVSKVNRYWKGLILTCYNLNSETNTIVMRSDVRANAAQRFKKYFSNLTPELINQLIAEDRRKLIEQRRRSRQ